MTDPTSPELVVIDDPPRPGPRPPMSAELRTWLDEAVASGSITVVSLPWRRHDPL